MHYMTPFFFLSLSFFRYRRGPTSCWITFFKRFGSPACVWGFLYAVAYNASKEGDLLFEVMGNQLTEDYMYHMSSGELKSFENKMPDSYKSINWAEKAKKL